MAPFRPPPPPPPPFAPSRAEEHMKYLSIGYYVLGGLMIPFSLVFLVHVAMGLFMVGGGFDDGRGGAPPAAVGFVFVVLGLFGVLVGLTMGSLTVYAGRCIAQRKHLVFVYIMAGILCMNMPFGTLLGVLTFVVLTRDDAKAFFRAAG